MLSATATAAPALFARGQAVHFTRRNSDRPELAAVTGCNCPAKQYSLMLIRKLLCAQASWLCVDCFVVDSGHDDLEDLSHVQRLSMIHSAALALACDSSVQVVR